MFREEPIYIQDSILRNREENPYSLSSDICTFQAPILNVDGADKIPLSGETIDENSNNVYFVDNTDTIDFLYEFSGLTSGTTTEFKTEIYRYKDSISQFDNIPIIKSNYDNVSGFTLEVDVSDLSIDGEFLIKGYYNHKICTEFLNKLGVYYDGSQIKTGSQYGLYNRNSDFYFVALREADTPTFQNVGTDLSPITSLKTLTYIPQTNGQREFLIGKNLVGDFFVTLNGLVLSEDYDYSHEVVDTNLDKITFSANTYLEDIINVIYVENGGGSLRVETIDVNSIIDSGATGTESSNTVFYNTTTNKYEVYTTLNPLDGNDVVLVLNGVVLSPEIDYYQSTSNVRRFILEGSIINGDIINIAYRTFPEFVDETTVATPLVYWKIDNAPQKENGYFDLQLSDSTDFTNIIFSATTDYVVDVFSYSDNLVLNGSLGDTYYYRVINYKNYETITGDIISSSGVSETVPITIQTNSLNNY